MHGSQIDSPNVPTCKIPSGRFSSSLRHTPSILRQQRDLSSMSQTAPSSLIWSGRTLSLEELSTSTQCSADSSPPRMMIPKLRSSETSRLPLEPSNLPRLSRMEVIGQSHGTGLYQCYYPTKQAKLLQLWDKISLPHEKAKQEYAPVLRIIGFIVDPKLMCVCMDKEDHMRLIQ